MIEKITGPVFEYLAEHKGLIGTARKVGLPLGGDIFCRWTTDGRNHRDGSNLKSGRTSSHSGLSR
ncbi:hypothetical protein [Exiguobacterium sp. s166]|uniref:hypothetical protein n=1 Tax=Exiguobacterium sp. s166 TaxID=2751204 RepID=UPI002036E5B9|nr:hypothetical protein [Exiguobacterium sp. s166]